MSTSTFSLHTLALNLYFSFSFSFLILNINGGFFVGQSIEYTCYLPASNLGSCAQWTAISSVNQLLLIEIKWVLTDNVNKQYLRLHDTIHDYNEYIFCIHSWIFFVGKSLVYKIKNAKYAIVERR